jgi:hypothetical protein
LITAKSPVIKRKGAVSVKMVENGLFDPAIFESRRKPVVVFYGKSTENRQGEQKACKATIAENADHKIVFTEYAAVLTECAAIFTEYAAVLTECAAIFTEYAAVLTECAAIFTEFAAVLTECAAIFAEYAAVLTECAAIFAECAAVFAVHAAAFVKFACIFKVFAFFTKNFEPYRQRRARSMI